jgi:hypothetical protein
MSALRTLSPARRAGSSAAAGPSAAPAGASQDVQVALLVNRYIVDAYQDRVRAARRQREAPPVRITDVLDDAWTRAKMARRGHSLDPRLRDAEHYLWGRLTPRRRRRGRGACSTAWPGRFDRSSTTG